MNIFFIFVLIMSVIWPSNCYEYNELRCGVCKVFMKELQSIVSKVNNKKTIDVGGYQLGADGSAKTKKVPMAESEIFLTEAMEKACLKLDDYARATLKDNGEFVLVNLIDTTARPGLSEVDIIQDGDLNRSLPHVCRGLIEEFDDDTFEIFRQKSTSPVEDLCTSKSHLCSPKFVEGNEYYDEKGEL